MTNTRTSLPNTRMMALFASLAFGTALPAVAQTGADSRLARSEARETRQAVRIDNGVAAGGINATEAERLQGQQTRIGNRTDRLTSDGFYSRRDHARISAQQSRSSRNIVVARANRR